MEWLFLGGELVVGGNQLLVDRFLFLVVMMVIWEFVVGHTFALNMLLLFISSGLLGCFVPVLSLSLSRLSSIALGSSFAGLSPRDRSSSPRLGWLTAQ